jgi:hypothetical protein
LRTRAKTPLLFKNNIKKSNTLKKFAKKKCFCEVNGIFEQICKANGLFLLGMGLAVQP